MMLYSTTTVEDSCKRRLVSSYFPFYNVLDLLNLSKLRGDEDMPELLIWKMFEEMLSAVQHNHCEQNVSHGDISTSNIFINLRLGEKFPEFFLGDFGVVAPLLKLGEKGYTVENEEVEGPQAQIEYDLQSLRDVIVTMAVGDAENGDAVGENYSRDLCDGIRSLENLTASVESNHRGYVANIGKLQNQINHSARRCKSRNVDWSFLKADDPYADAETYESVAAALNADSLPPGPFQVVKVDSKSWRILQKDHQIMFPLRCRPLESA